MKVSAKKYKVTDGKGFKLEDMPTSEKIDKKEKDEYLEVMQKNQEKMAALQDRLYADGSEGLVIVLQAMDAAGKDGTIKHVMSGVNPQGVDVHSFKQPSKADLAHGFLWRVEECIPERGKIGLFNRSWYEDCLVTKVREMNKTYHMPKRCTGKSTKEFYEDRYEDIANYEKYLYRAGYRIVKIFLHVSKEEQKERFLERIDRPEKNWKFSSSDVAERKLWDEYQKAYEDAIRKTAAPHAPWYVLPADQKWFTRCLVSEILVDVLEDIDPQYPTVSEEAKAQLATSREELMNE